MLEKMKSFVVLSESASFTEAAKRLFCSQPTISNHIHQLEQYFNTKLLKEIPYYSFPCNIVKLLYLNVDISRCKELSGNCYEDEKSHCIFPEHDDYLACYFIGRF